MNVSFLKRTDIRVIPRDSAHKRISMKKSVILLSLLLLAFGCSKAPKDQKQDLFDKGMSLLDDYQYAEADSTFAKISNLDPTSPFGLFGQGLVLQRKQQYYDAISLYMTIADVSPQFAPAARELYHCFTELGYRADAVTSALTYNRLKPEDRDSYLCLARAFLYADNPTRAAEVAAQGVTKVSTDVAPLELIQAAAYQAGGKLDSASILSGKAFANSSKSLEFLEAAADYFETKGEIDSAMAMSRLAYEEGKSTETTLQYIDRGIRTKYFDAASRTLTQLSENKVPDLPVTTMRLRLNIASGDRVSARHAGDSLQILDPVSISSVMNDITSRATVGDMLTVSQDIPVLENRLKDGNFAEPFRQFMKYAIAILYAHYELSPPTIAKLSGIHDVHANYREVKLRLALGYFTVGLTDSCLKYVDIAYNGHQNQPEWLTQIGDIYSYISMRRYKDAAKMYKLALEKNGWYVPALEGYVAMYADRGLQDSALMVFDQYKYFAEKNPLLALDKAQTLVDAGKVSEGIDLFSQEIPSDRGNTSRFRKLLESLEKQDPSKIKQVNDLLVKLNSDNARSMVLAALYDIRFNQARNALDYANKALQLDTALSNAWVEKAHAMYASGDKSGGIRLFEENLKRFPADARNQFYLSSVLADEKIDFDRASNLARQAVFNSFGDPEYVLNLSQVYYRMGRFDLSRGEAWKASNALKDDPAPYFLLGMANFHLKAGGKDVQKGDIKDNLQKALRLGLAGTDKDSAQVVLRKL